MPHQATVKSRQFITHSADQTIELGRKLGAEWAAEQRSRSMLVLLIGDLGSGKTTLTKGIVAGIGAAQENQVTSPTYTLVQEYGEREEQKVFHVDLYRIEDPREVASLGLDDLFSRDSMVLVEWGEKLPSLAGRQRVEIHLECLRGDERSITIESIHPIESGEAEVTG